ncbi:c-type cytochrome [Cupriavidus consociatus]|uniref:c-type cytochrome n=1 Tax=Cupriavidus consociatus TaxID=2821357 RepID=UPI001AEB78E4|nr:MULTISPECIES: cytochrome c [unclassified Cupriavidus]MBP0623341.1 cytochrome c [Cupriavidus sp. LEh25]MDK2660039.1 cytochrome c [Cupriavidus sp. LEh21]
MRASRYYVTVACLSAAFALPPAYAELGRTATPEEISGWNIDISPSGIGLPKTHGTVAEGEKIYQNACMSCHGVNLEGGLGPALVGGKDTLASSKPLKTVGSYWPYATTLFDYIRRAMPFQAPQTLSNEDVYSVTGFILHKNGLMPATATVDGTTLTNLSMPNRNSFYVDDRPDVKNERCMKNCLRTTASKATK